MQKRLTDRVVAQRAPAAGNIEIWDGLLPGFGIRIGKRKRTYFVMSRIGGKQVRRRVGSTIELSLAEARDKARTMLRDFANGTDPAEAERAKKREAKRARRNTFGAIVEEFLQDRCGKLRTRGEIERKLAVDILPLWRDIPITELGRADVKALFRAKAARSPIAANRLLSLIRNVLNYAIDEEWIESNPAARIKPEPEPERERFLTAPEIKSFWHGLDNAPVEKEVRQVLRFLLVTGQRRSEAVGARWDEFDLEAREWTIPADRVKNGRTHVVPLSELALELLGGMGTDDGDFVFPGAFGDAPLSPYSVSQGMRKSLKAMKLADKPATPHDLRRTFASGLTELGTPRLTVSRLLNHTEGGVTSIYDRHDYAPEMRRAMDAWSNKLREIITGEAAPLNVRKLADVRA